jgi:hypothetical protein
VTKTRAIDQRALAGRLAVALAGFVGLALLVVPSARPGQQSITIDPAAPTTASGVAFTVTTGGGNREFASVRVSCSDSSGEVYATVLTVEVPPKSSGTSQRIYPPASDCDATLEKLMSIGKSRVLASVHFTVAP